MVRGLYGWAGRMYSVLPMCQSPGRGVPVSIVGNTLWGESNIAHGLRTVHTLPCAAVQPGIVLPANVQPSRTAQPRSVQPTCGLYCPTKPISGRGRTLAVRGPCSQWPAQPYSRGHGCTAGLYCHGWPAVATATAVRLGCTGHGWPAVATARAAYATIAAYAARILWHRLP